MTEPKKDPLPWDDPNADPLGDIIAELDLGISQTANPLLRDCLIRMRDRWIARRDKP